MNVKVGGSMGYKIQGAPYESIDAMSIITIEKEVPDDFSAEKLQEFSDRITNMLEKDIVKKLKTAIETYKEKVNKLKALL